MIRHCADTRHMTRAPRDGAAAPALVDLRHLVQPMIWLLLFGALFEAVTDIPGFGSDNYIQFLAPGVVVMTAFFTAGWSGMPMIDDLERGVIDRFLVSPVRRSSLITGRLAAVAITIVVQTRDHPRARADRRRRVPERLAGVAALTGVAILLGAAFGAISNGIALLARREETVIALMQFLMLPLSFLSATFMQKDLMPDWMQTASGSTRSTGPSRRGARRSPRRRLGPDRRARGSAGGVPAASMFFAARAFRSYQRSV